MGDGTQVRASGQSVGMAGRALLLALEQRAPRHLLVLHPAALHLTLWAPHIAAAGVVHTCGGFAAAVGAIVLGPRHGRYDSGVVAQQYQQGPNPALYLLGSFLLWFGW